MQSFSPSENCSSRLGIFVFYDKEGIVDNYVEYLLNDLKENLTQLVIVCNGILSAQGRKRLLKYSDIVIIRENSGFDAAAWKYAMTEYLGWDVVDQYDEIVLLNDTFFGPFYPFKTVFERMALRDIDFWGITRHRRVDDIIFKKCPYPYLPSHIQSYFCVIRRKMHTSDIFKDYWEKQPTYQNFEDVIGGNEITFSQYFLDHGFEWDTLVDTSSVESEYNFNPTIYCPDTLLRLGCPILKRKSFSSYNAFYDAKIMNTQTCRALQFIKDQTNYDLDCIYQTILRLYNISDIYDNLHLNYILPTVQTSNYQVNNCRAIVVLHLSCADTLENYISNIIQFPLWMDVLIIAHTAEVAERARLCTKSILGKRVRIVVTENREKSFFAFLMTVSKFSLVDYQFLCFFCDYKTSGLHFCSSYSFEQLSWENALSSTAFIENTISCFMEEKRLGILISPWSFGSIDEQMWANSFDETKKLADKLKLTVNISCDKPSLANGTSFWCRTVALKRLFEVDWNDPAIIQQFQMKPDEISCAAERILPFVSQQEGYYTGWLMTTEYAGAEICNLRFVGTEKLRQSKGFAGIREAIKSYVKKKVSTRTWERCKKVYKKLK